MTAYSSQTCPVTVWAKKVTISVTTTDLIFPFYNSNQPTAHPSDLLCRPPEITREPKKNKNHDSKNKVATLHVYTWMGNIAFTLENLEYLYIKYLKQYKQFYMYFFQLFFWTFFYYQSTDLPHEL